MTLLPGDALKRDRRMTVVCAGCGETFLRPRKQFYTKNRKGVDQYCSPGCYYRSKTKGKSRICRHCGGTFASPGLLRYCSRACFRDRSLQRKTVTCKQCGKPFVKIRPALTSRYCSKKCIGISQRKAMPKSVCKGCGKDIYAEATTRKRVYCSKECQAEHAQGVNSAMFRGGTLHFRGKGWCKGRREARLRDTACVCCGKLPEPKQQLSVDHIVPFRLVKEYFKDVPLGPNPNDLVNLACLCRQCHSRKTATERHVLDGNMVRFLAETQVIIPIERINAALKLWGLM